MPLKPQRWLALILVVCAIVSSRAFAQTTPPDYSTAPPPTQLPQDQLDSLLAPIALYPDQLLSQVLMASTYPLEVVEAARFVQQNPGLKGDALDQMLATKPWDPSVLSLAGFPQVLVMMNDKLDWTQQLGDAFLANEAQVMQTVQSLRARAQAAGNLQNTPQQNVIVQERTIIIEPAQPQVVYVPVYNPTVIYGPWWAPAYRPWYWYPPPIYGYPPFGSAFGVGFVWGSAWVVSANHWGWSHPNWRGGNVNININNNYFYNRPQYQNRYANGNWQHMPEHRKGVAYRDTNVQNRYLKTNNAAVQSRENYRGRDVSRPTQGQPGAATQGQPNAGVSRPGTMDRSGSAATSRFGDRPTSTERPATGSTMARPGSTNTAVTNSRTSTPMARQPAPVNAGQTPAPTFNANQSRPQTQQFSDRGAQSRATMNSAPSRSAGGGAGTRNTGSGGGAHGGDSGGGDSGGGGGGRGR